ncbi:OmpA family protein [Flavobacterium sp.]|jgi:outer membrane protein OmpA-like peptidoglycan-associated protein/tetratricopeptide (TPR) repeat protein|uniref:OmpA family protein n=1 Tax=Flavobacterium sp. TaxID=239 RepID=UPI0022C46095|nr:OmpA family protein [Flavobacterium sp.]MCZ8145031.1 OmpA family protein [Flavobacterium sp.]MCZ8368033.1 OmpA family protein [Flavobacterium sp.]
MKNKFLHIALIAIATCSTLTAQNNKVAKGTKQYDNYAYVDAIKTYERIFAKGYKSQDMLQKLGDSYYYKGDYDNAAKWYTELFAFTKEVTPEYYFRYAQALKATKDYKKADEMMAAFNQKSGNEQRAKLAASQKDYMAQIKKNSGRFTLENAGINSEYSDYGTSYYGTKVVFSTARDTGGIGKRKHTWTGESFTNLYTADLGEQGALSNPKRMNEGLNSRFNESTSAFTKDGKTVYFTRNSFLTKREKNSKGSTLQKIYTATLENGKWVNIKELPFCSEDYQVAHPTLSADEKTLYFASDMPGTKGVSDLYKVAINGDGTFGTPENLGDVINTEGRETFPMIAADGEFYFASDGHPGLGGLDVFMAKVQPDGSFKRVHNVGEPVNSNKDDFAFIINAKDRTGYVSSNREGGNGNDDIYRFKENTRLVDCEQAVHGIVTDKETGKPLAGVSVVLQDQNFKILKEMKTDAEGKFDFGTQDCETKFYIKSTLPEYNTVDTPLMTANETGKTFVHVEMERTVKPVTVGDDLFKAFGIKIIYFDLDKSNIRPDAAVELAKILDILEQYPTMEIDVRSHTDCRQTYKYNMSLSDRRAKSTVAWLIKNGIAASRLTGKGYGESQLVNDCACEPTNKSECTEEQHQANRRSEFIITKL